MTGDGEPIFVFPTVLPTDDKEDTHPVLMASVCVSKDKCMLPTCLKCQSRKLIIFTAYGVEYFEWLTILLQELSIALDENFLNEMLNFVKAISPYKPMAPSLIPTQSSVAVPKPVDDEDIMYFDRLLLHPIQFNISFAKSQQQKREKGTNR
jgi:hypothetical protein